MAILKGLLKTAKYIFLLMLLATAVAMTTEGISNPSFDLPVVGILTLFLIVLVGFFGWPSNDQDKPVVKPIETVLEECNNSTDYVLILNQAIKSGFIRDNDYVKFLEKMPK